MQHIHRPTARSVVLIKGYGLGSGETRTVTGAFLSYTIVQFSFDREFKFDRPWISRSARRIGDARAFTPGLPRVWYRRSPKMLSSYCPRSLWSLLDGLFQRDLAVPDEIGESPQSTQPSHLRRAAQRFGRGTKSHPKVTPVWPGSSRRAERPS